MTPFNQAMSSIGFCSQIEILIPFRSLETSDPISLISPLDCKNVTLLSLLHPNAFVKGDALSSIYVVAFLSSSQKRSMILIDRFNT